MGLRKGKSSQGDQNTKELDELDVPPQCKLQFPDANKIMSFVLDLRPDEGFWRGASYRFTFIISPLYPHEAPKVKCDTKIYHPNIDLQGNVCLNILREEWKPVLSISSVIYGILHLFSEPNPNDPLNHEAAKMLRDDRYEFERLVTRSSWLHSSRHAVSKISLADSATTAFVFASYSLIFVAGSHDCVIKQQNT